MGTLKNLLKRAEDLVDRGDYLRAISSFDKALEIKPDDYLAWYNRGITLKKLGRYKDTIAFFDNALEIKPE